MTRSSRTRNLAKLISAAILIILVVGFLWKIRSISRPRGSISGTIVDTTGSVISGASVTLKNVDNGFVSERTLSESESSFHLARIPPGNYVIQISKATFDEFESAPIAVGPYTAANLGQIVLDFPPALGLHISNVVVEKLLKTPIVVGRVVDRNSQAVADAKVRLLTLGSRQTRETSTNDNGEFEFERLPLGLYAIKVFKQGFKDDITGKLDAFYGKESRIAEIALQREEPTEVKTQTNLDKHVLGSSGKQDVGIIEGTVEGPDKIPISGAYVEALNAPANVYWKQQTNSKGEFLLQALPDGNYIVSISATGFLNLIVKDVSVRTRPVQLGHLIVRPAAPTEEITVISELPLRGRNFQSLKLSNLNPVREHDKKKPDSMTQRILDAHARWVLSNGKQGARCNLRLAELTDIDLRGSNLFGAVFAGADLSNSDLAGVIAEKSVLSGIDLRDSNLSNAYLRASDLSEANLEGTSLLNAQLEDAYALSADFSYADLTGTKSSGAYLYGTNLTNADMSSANLENANLEHALLVGAKLRDAKLNAANLNGAEIAQAVLDHTDFRGAKLDQANLTGAVLVGTELAGTSMAEADFAHAVFEPRSLPDVREFAAAKHLELIRYDHSPDALAALRKQFSDGGYREQERQITYALKRREVEFLRNDCNYTIGLENCLAYGFNRLFFDLTCQYGMNSGRPLELGLLLWFICSFIYAGFIHGSGRAALYRAYAAQLNDAAPRIERIEPSQIKQSTRFSFAPRFLRREIGVLGTAMFFSLMCAFNIGFRDINFGRWLRLLTREEYDIRPAGWVRVVAGWQSLASVYLIALWVLTYFSRPFG